MSLRCWTGRPHPATSTPVRAHLLPAQSSFVHRSCPGIHRCHLQEKEQAELSLWGSHKTSQLNDNTIENGVSKVVMPHLSLFQCNLLCFDATSSLREENSKKTQATVRSLIVRLHLFWKHHRTLRCLSSCVFKLQHSTVRTERTIASKASHLDEKLLCVAVVHAVHCSGQQVDQLSLKGPSVRSEQRLLHSDPHTNPQMRNPQMMKIELSTKKAESPSPSCGKRHRS